MAQTIRDLPEFLDDVRLVVRVTGPIRALKGPPDGGGPPGGGGNGDGNGVDPKDIQTPPIQLGTSGGWRCTARVASPTRFGPLLVTAVYSQTRRVSSRRPRS